MYSHKHYVLRPYLAKGDHPPPPALNYGIILVVVCHDITYLLTPNLISALCAVWPLDLWKGSVAYLNLPVLFEKEVKIYPTLSWLSEQVREIERDGYRISYTHTFLWRVNETRTNKQGHCKQTNKQTNLSSFTAARACNVCGQHI